MPEGEIEIEVGDDRKVLINTSFGTYSIMGKQVEEFPSIPELDNHQMVQLAASLLKRVIDKTAFAASREELKPSLMGVLFQIREDSFKAVATDGHRLVKHIRNDYKGEGYQGDNIVPVKFLQILSAYLEGDEQITLYIGDNHIMMESQETKVFTRIIDERFPDYESVFPKDNDKSLKIDRQEFLSAIKRVSIFSNKTTHQIALRLSSDEIEITTEDVETISTARESLSGEYKGEALVVGYNSNYFRDILSHVDSSNVLVELRSPVSAAVIYPEEQEESEELAMLLMPIRLND